MESHCQFRRIARICAPALVAGLFLSGCGINNIPAYWEIARARWSDVVYEYSRRGDLVRTLPSIVQGHLGEKRQPIEDVVEARAHAHQAVLNMPTEILNDRDAFRHFAQAQQELTAALSRLLTVCARSGYLVGNQKFSELLSQLEASESRIAGARRDYNEAVEQYNRELRTFPGTMWGATLYQHNKAMQIFTAAEP